MLVYLERWGFDLPKVSTYCAAQYTYSNGLLKIVANQEGGVPRELVYLNRVFYVLSTWKGGLLGGVVYLEM